MTLTRSYLIKKWVYRSQNILHVEIKNIQNMIRLLVSDSFKKSEEYEHFFSEFLNGGFSRFLWYQVFCIDEFRHSMTILRYDFGLKTVSLGNIIVSYYNIPQVMCESQSFFFSFYSKLMYFWSEWLCFECFLPYLYSTYFITHLGFFIHFFIRV